MQTSYSVDRAGTAEQEAEAAEEPSAKAISDMAEIVGALAASLPKRIRRTREQIEQEKIEKAQQRIEAIKTEQRVRRVKRSRELLLASYEAFEDSDLSTEIGDAFRILLSDLREELGE